jgi:hypothetical protein
MTEISASMPVHSRNIIGAVYMPIFLNMFFLRLEKDNTAKASWSVTAANMWYIKRLLLVPPSRVSHDRSTTTLLLKTIWPWPAVCLLRDVHASGEIWRRKIQLKYFGLFYLHWIVPRAAPCERRHALFISVLIFFVLIVLNPEFLPSLNFQGRWHFKRRNVV